MIVRLFFLLFTLCAGCSETRAPIGRDFYPADIEAMGYSKPMPPPPQVLKPLIVIDAGHGGVDQGTLSDSKPAYQEKSLTLATAKIVRDYLQKLGYRVKMTRNEDVFIALSTRATIANEAGAALFVSIHFNSAPNPEAYGIEIFYYLGEGDPNRAARSKELAGQVLSEVLERCKAKSRGVKKGNFAVIRETKMPAILIEGGFLTNQEELGKIKDPQYLKQLAWGITQGVDKYLNNQL